MRPSLGKVEIDWQKAAFGRGKYRRKTVGCGKYDKKERTWSDLEIYIREMSIIDAGIGCAVWDASIILTRWIYKNRHFFADKSVLELGAGCGAPGIACGRYAKQVVLSDYLPSLIENLTYNIALNSSLEDVTDTPEIECRKRLSTASALLLDWNDPKSYADVGLFDVIIGSELTYANSSQEFTLIPVLHKYLKDTGLFFEILSDDRDGVKKFLVDVVKHGFVFASHPVPEEFLGRYGTKQRPETYHFYTFWKAEKLSEEEIFFMK